ncbi:hypothetical protein [Zooshikella sp. RANM57]|uniref:hypothetical protein n=1 Tax=Zooshikella sp. RANM57 TaxID=3425863 RepID=UPI003D6FBC8F
MENHYQPPQSDSRREDDNAISRWIVPSSLGLTFVSGIIYFAIYKIVPQFKEVFDGFGTDLPLLTLFIIDTYYFYSILILVGVIPCILLFNNRYTYRAKQKKLFSLVIFNLILSFLIFCSVLIGLYWPIFQLGSVV